MAFEGIFQTFINKGRETRKREDNVELARKGQFDKDVEAFRQRVKDAASAFSNAAAKRPDSVPALEEIANTIVRNGELLQEQGANVNPRLVEQILKTAISTPTQEQAFKTKLSQTEQLNTAQARGAAAGTPKEPLDINATAKFAVGLLQDDIEPDKIRNILDQIKAQNPDASAQIDSIIETLPESQEAFRRRIAEADVAAQQPRIDALVANGIDPQLATILTIGGNRAAVNIDANPQRFTPQELRDIRKEVRESSRLADTLEDIIPLINEDSVGLLAGFSENVGGIGQQIPVINSIFNALGGVVGLDEKSVNNAQTARSAFRRIIGPMARFILQNKQRLSNQQIELVNQATGLLNARTKPDQAKQILNNFIKLAREAAEDSGADLESGGLSTEDQDITVTRDANGNVVIKGM